MYVIARNQKAVWIPDHGVGGVPVRATIQLLESAIPSSAGVIWLGAGAEKNTLS